MDKLVRADLYRYGGLKGIKGFLRGLLIPGFRYTYFFRKVSKNSRNPILRLFYSFLKRHASYKFGFQIPAKTEIGGGFFIGHFGTIVINENSKIGRNCNIAHSVTIGRTNRGKLKGSPIIGDNVWIGTGAVIVGKITVASNVLIAPNSFVNINIPSNSIAIGNPVKVIKKDNPTDGYINFRLS